MARLSALTVALLLCATVAHAQYWVAPMQAVRQNYNDTNGPTQGAISRFGDSITVSMAFFQPLRYSISNTDATEAAALSWIQSWNTSASWGWQADAIVAQHGAWGGEDSSWPLESASDWGGLAGERRVDYWLRNDNPEMAVIMFGTNDLQHGLTAAQVQSNLTQIVQACKANGTIPILSTIPPRHNYDNGTTSNQQKAADFDAAIHAVATAEQIPLIDFHAEILARHPTDWDGADSIWNAYSGYEVPTSIARDGVHPSNYSAGKANFSEYGLDVNGFNLRNHGVLLGTYEVYNQVIVPEPISLTLLGLGGLALLRRRR